MAVRVFMTNAVAGKSQYRARSQWLGIVCFARAYIHNAKQRAERNKGKTNFYRLDGREAESTGGASAKNIYNSLEPGGETAKNPAK